MKNYYLSFLFFLIASVPVFAQVKISAMPETKEDPAGGWIPVVLSNKNYKYNPGSYVQQRTIENIRGLSPTNLPANYVYYVTDLGKEGFFRYDASDVDKPNDNPPTKASADDGATVLVTKNNLRFRRIIENNTVNAKWFEMGNDPSAPINTLKYLNNAVITYEQAKAIFDKPNSRVKLSKEEDFSPPAPKTPQTATWFALQRAINFCLASGNKLYIPAGEYRLSKGLLVAPMGGFAASFEIEGSSVAYSGWASQTRIIIENKNSFGIGFQLGKAIRVRNIYLSGQNLITGSLYDIVENPNMDWTHGCRNDPYSPHAGFVVDPLFGVGAAPDENKYPDFKPFYTDPTGGGSTDIIFENCRVLNFVVGIAFSPGGSQANGEAMSVNNCWVDYCKSAIAVGQSQNRNINVNNLKCWGWTETLFDSRDYGMGQADYVDVDGLQIAGGVKFLAKFNGFQLNKGLQIRRMHAESLFALGSASPSWDGGGLVIDDSFISLIGSQPSQSGTPSIHAARLAFSGGRLKMTNSFFGQVEGNTMPISISSGHAVFENCSFYENIAEVMPTNVGEIDNVWNGWTNAYTHFVDLKGKTRTRNLLQGDQGGGAPCLIGSSFDIKGINYKRTCIDNTTFYSALSDFFAFWTSKEITFNQVDDSAQEGNFTLPPTSDDFDLLRIGDFIYSKDLVSNDFGTTNTFLLGKVSAKDATTGNITITSLARGINKTTSYSLLVRRYRYYLPLLVGDVTLGSKVVTNMFHEAANLDVGTDYLIKATIQSPFFPTGTYIVSHTSNSITLSNKALASAKGIEVIAANTKATIFGYGKTDAFKEGDEIINTDVISYPNLTKSICIKSGIFNTPYPPEFINYYKNKTRTLTGPTGTLDIDPDVLVTSIIVKPTVALTGFKIGTTPNGADVLASIAVAANAEKVINLNRYFRNKTTLYISGISGSVEVIIPK